MAWKKTPLKSVIIVTNRIEDTVLLADRVLILSSNPGRIVSEMKITLHHPRNSQTEEFQNIIDKIYTTMSTVIEHKQNIEPQTYVVLRRITHKLPHVYPHQLAALASAIISESQGGDASFARLAKILHLDISNLLSTSEALEMLKLANVHGGNIELTEAGLRFVLHDIKGRKKIFADLFIQHVPIISYICKVLTNNNKNTASFQDFQKLLEVKLSRHNAINILKTAIVWGRYADLFKYDSKSQIFTAADAK